MSNKENTSTKRHREEENLLFQLAPSSLLSSLSEKYSSIQGHIALETSESTDYAMNNQMVPSSLVHHQLNKKQYSAADVKLIYQMGPPSLRESLQKSRKFHYWLSFTDGYLYE
jgi:hypothetical protein